MYKYSSIDYRDTQMAKMAMEANIRENLRQIALIKEAVNRRQLLKILGGGGAGKATHAAEAVEAATKQINPVTAAGGVLSDATVAGNVATNPVMPRRDALPKIVAPLAGQGQVGQAGRTVIKGGFKGAMGVGEKLYELLALLGLG